MIHTEEYHAVLRDNPTSFNDILFLVSPRIDKNELQLYTFLTTIEHSFHFNFFNNKYIY